MSLDLNTALDELRTETGWLADGESTYVDDYWNVHHGQRPRNARPPHGARPTALSRPHPATPHEDT